MIELQKRDLMEEQIKNILEKSFPNSNIEVNGSDAKYIVKVVSDDFVDKSMIERHKIIYVLLNKFILTGEIHALTITSLTNSENEK
tara:strand:- start:69 stop:326 length:258 start_codon:yes stop_codon:yes gene_type:complete